MQVADAPIMSLDLSHNQLTGTIPTLQVSKSLVLSHNKLSGDISVFQKFPWNVKVLDLSHNEL